MSSRNHPKKLALACVAATLLLASPARAADAKKYATVALDVVVARPALLFATLGGTVAYTVSLPLTFPAGMEEDAKKRFLTAPYTLLTSPIGE